MLDSFSRLPKDYLVLLVSALPVLELRGGIPLALSLGIPPFKAFLLGVAGNSLIVLPALFLFEPVTCALRRFKLWAGFFDWLFERTRKKADRIQKYESLGLALLVAVPLPMTGAWTGVIAASLFKIRFRYAFPAIIAGVLCAGVIVLLLSLLGILSWKAVGR
ncbi:MAG: small multi-drug export protein [Candidatus Omnitrophica bacterium]|nr:small multi-drug export protein [Candidatus Omnitrophota bacterium]